MASKLDEDSRERLSVRMCDLGRKEDISELFNFIESTMGRLDVCVNCAGFSHYTTLTDGDAEQWEQMLNVNVLAVAVCSKEAIGLMRKHGDNSGHIVNISSNLAHYGPPSDHNYLRFYSCTKFALKSFNEGLRQELRDQKSSIRISSISPGLVRTEFMGSVLKTHPEKLENYYDQYPALEPSDVAGAVIYALSTPRHVEINEIVMYSTEKIADYSD
ncbi:dehydrogenase/reductase SDR family member 11-like [Paramacrobiotus metropolitanus]|uniref:dehydrogenase/reductase SDR family member 11-like n=1 Tax=Paramacrobiotus metropolitanus TaxID=2943436 RepID=UPI0024465AA3|nr:dehydrogenase/reductase SDR family member 11-like [Paramacrobiotus metropolitanus]